MMELEDKYIDLLLNRCLNFDISKSLFISYDIVNQDFVSKVINKVKSMGITDIGVDVTDINLTIEKIKNTPIEDIEKDPFFNKSMWDFYAERNANFLMIDTEFPHFMDGVDPEKIAAVKKVNRNTRELFRKKETTFQIPWCIAAVPNEFWAKDIFGDNPDSYDKLYDVIFRMCMVTDGNPIENWDNYLEKVKNFSKRLDELEITKMHYKNSLGTDLVVEMPKDVKWSSAANDSNGKMLVNMPSYEIFSSPHYLKTEGIVYSSKPLVYAGGLIDEFYIEFKEGKVVNYDAKVGKDILKGIIESDDNSCYLGEVALVNNDSPISNTGLVFGTTLFDENASCHLALGDGFGESIENGLSMEKEELLSHGINQSKQHVDFMIGTPDLEIEAETKEGTIFIFKDGNFCI